MNCRLCNEKIPRMRALFKKSEFCSDEHAEQYKHQTLNRLLADTEQRAESVAPLPLPATDDVPLASLESRTPLLEGQTAHNGPRRLAPPGPVLPRPESQSGFGGLLDRLPAKPPAAGPPGKRGGWDEAGGEDPLEALMRLESDATAPPAGLGPATSALPPAFNSAPSAASSSEDDAISALRRLAEEARQAARPTPLTGPEADAEAPIARVSGDDDWRDEGNGQILLGGADGGSRSGGFPFEELEAEDARPKGGSADSLSMFDRLVRDFHSDTGPAPDESIEESALPLSAASQPTGLDATTSDASSEEHEAPFAGSMFDRLMADKPLPKRAKPPDPVPANASEAAAPACSADARQAELIESPTEGEPEAAGFASPERDASEPLAADAVGLDAAEADPPQRESREVTLRYSTVRARSRKAAPIVARTELLELAASGWRIEIGSTGESEPLERLFAEQLASEASLYAPGTPVPIEPSRISVPVRGGIQAATSGKYGRAGAIPEWAGLRPIETASPGSAAPATVEAWQSAGNANEPLPAAPQAQLPGRPAANGHTSERLRAVSICGRVMEIGCAKPDAIPPATSPLPAPECLPGRAGLAQPQPLPARAAANAGKTLGPPCLKLANFVMQPEPPHEPTFLGHDPAALPPRGTVRLPGAEQNGTCASGDTITLPDAVAGLVGTEPQGSTFEPADREQTRRLVAERTATAIGENGGAGSKWNPALGSGPFHPALGVENGNRH